MQFLEKLQPLALLVLRVAVGLTFVTHGYPKLITDPAGWVRMMPQFGFPGYFAYIAGVLELFGGGLLIAGLFTRGAALLLAVEMTLALVRTHIPSSGIYAVAKYELPMLLAAGAFALACFGAGAISIDAFTFESPRKSAKKKKS